MLFSVKFWVFMKKKWKVIQTEMKERPLPYEALTILCLKSWFKDRIAFLLTFIALTWIWLKSLSLKVNTQDCFKDLLKSPSWSEQVQKLGMFG